MVFQYVPKATRRRLEHRHGDRDRPRMTGILGRPAATPGVLGGSTEGTVKKDSSPAAHSPLPFTTLADGRTRL